MFIPEYSITGKILKDVASVEYGKAVIENTTIFPNWEKQLQKEAEILFIEALMAGLGKRVDQRSIKSYLDGIKPLQDPAISNLKNALELIDVISKNIDLGEDDVKEIYKALIGEQPTYRMKKLPQRTDPDEILAKMVELMDWCNSLDAKETHPIIRSGILRAYLEALSPFESRNAWVASLVSLTSLKSSTYDFKGYIYLESYYEKYRSDYSKAFSSVKEDDFTQWLEFYVEAFANEVTNLKEKVLLLFRDTKVAKASGTADLTERQERIVEYLQDYGILQNKAFPTIFPDVSEDSILRDLKVLANKGIVVKRGKTKSSRYELR